MLSDMDMDDLDLEESECFSPDSSEESSEESSFKSWGLQDDHLDEFCLRPKSPEWSHKKNKTFKPPNFLQKLYYREIGGYYTPDQSKNFNRMSKPAFQRIRLADILPLSASKLNHVFLGMSKCGQFLLSYTYTTELDVMSFNTVYKYRLHWWAFTPNQKARKVSEVMLFGNHGIYSTLYIAVCQWPLDYTRVLVYGNCCETYMGSVSQAERSYLTITTVPSLNKCQDCLKVAASYEEEDLAANWDSCVRFSCLKHSVTVHSTFDVVSPYPKFDPAVSMKRDGTVVFNTGNQLHVLRAELVYVDGNYPQVNARSGPMVSEPHDGNVAMASHSHCTQSKPADNTESHDSWTEESKLITKPVHEKSSDNPNILLLSCPYNTRSHALSPSVSSLNDKGVDCKDGATISYSVSCTVNSTSERSLDKRYDDDDDDMDEDCSEFDSKHFSQMLTENKLASADDCDMTNKVQCMEEGDSDKVCVFTRHIGDGFSNFSKKSCDTSKQCDISICRSELDSFSFNNRSGKDKISDEIYVGRLTRSQTSRRNFISETSVDDDSELDVPQHKKYLYPVEDVWGRETHTIDSTQELNISCGNINSCSKSAQSTITLMSPVQKSLLIVSPSDEGRFNQPSQSHMDSKHTSSPPRRKMLRNGNPVKFYSSPLPPSQPKVHSKMAAEAEKAYEFTDDIPDTTGEKLSSYRKRRLADKKYEFIEEGEDLENIVPYRLHRRREPTRHRSPPVLIAPSPVILNHRRRHHDVDSEDGHFNGQWVSSSLPYNSLSSEIHSTGNHLDPDKVVLRPLNQNTSGPMLLSPRDREAVSTDRSKIGGNKKSQSEVVGVSEEVNNSGNADPGGDNVEGTITDTENDPGIVPAQCTVQLKRHYIEVDDELISVITDIEDDDLNEGIGFHCALPLEVHGAGYVQLQMISNSKAEKLMAPCVMVLQRSFDVEQFCHKIAERLCEESGKKYWFCNDYDVEIVDVCPLSGDVIALAMMRIQATVKTKGLAKSQRHPVSSQQRRQYQGGCHFVWNLDTGDYSVVDTKALTDVDSSEEKDPWNPARDLARQLRQKLPQIPVLHSVRHVCNKPALRGVSATRYEDSDNMIELVLQ